MLLEAARSHIRSLQESPKPSNCGQATGPSLGWWLILKPPRYVRRGEDTHVLHLWRPGLTPGLGVVRGCNCGSIRKARPPEAGSITWKCGGSSGHEEQTQQLCCLQKALGWSSEDLELQLSFATHWLCAPGKRFVSLGCGFLLLREEQYS